MPFWPTRVLILWALVVTTVAHAYTCSSSEQEDISAYYASAAKRAGCAPNVTYTATGAIDFSFTCNTTSCTPTLVQLADKIPSCESTDGVNRRAQLEYKLFTECKLCTVAQDDEITALWKEAAKTPACVMYASTSSFMTSFSWPCSATGCTAVLKALAEKVPECFTGTTNEKNRILNAVRYCTRTTPSKVTQSPSANANGSASGSDGNGEEITADENATSAPCTSAEVAGMATQFKATAKKAVCKGEVSMGTHFISAITRCNTTCVTTEFKALASALPDCYDSKNQENVKRGLQQELERCADPRTLTFTFSFTSTTDFYESAVATPASTISSATPSPAQSTANDDRSVRWLPLVAALPLALLYLL